ncbi:MAG: TIGR03087 family PEP-CTERM/XrtA system glycosyltransferase, partial [Planctomycetaceae bacterium]
MPRRVLYLVHRFPCPPDKGDRIRAFHIIRFLAERCDLHVAALADEPVSDEARRELSRRCARLHVSSVSRWGRWPRAALSAALGRTISEGAFASNELRSVIRQWAGERPFDGVIASASSMTPYLRLPELRGARTVVDLVDVDSEKWLQYAAESRGPRRRLYAWEGRRLRELEQRLLNWVDAVTLVSSEEARLYRDVCSLQTAGRNGPSPPRRGVVRAITNGVDLEYFR